MLYGTFEGVEISTNIKELYFQDVKLSFNVRLKQLPRNMLFALQQNVDPTGIFLKKKAPGVPSPETPPRFHLIS